MILRQPFPAYASWSKTLLYTGYAGLCVFLLLVLLQPFGIAEGSHGRLVPYALLYGLLTFAISSANALLLPKWLPQVYKEERWTLGKELVTMTWQILSIAIANLLLTHWLYHSPLTLRHLLNFMWITGAVGVFPVALVLLLKQQLLLKRYQVGAALLDRQLQAPAQPAMLQPVPVQPVVFYSENQKESFRIAADKIWYITAADNYIRIHYIEEGKPLVHLLRSTLRKAEASLVAHPSFFRCHRTYIVNLAAIEHVSGNAQGYKLHLKAMPDIVPVSRNLNATLTNLLQSNHLLPGQPA